MSHVQCEAKICERGGKGVLLPLFDNEQEWPNGLRVVLYFIGLLYTFMGVAIVADVFMGAIEQITSQKRKVLNPKTGNIMTVPIWNETVANLTLMALGSSAPEILLSVIELLGKEFYAGDLGPSTIVGSAAFNLFCIIAVCVSAIPNGQVRYIKDLNVFFVTAMFSLFAYLWLYMIVSVITPDVVDVWEGVLTFIYFPVLIVLAYLADRGYFSRKSDEDDDEVPPHMCIDDMTPQQIAEMQMRIQQEHNCALSTQEVAKIIHHRTHLEHKSRAHYRVGAIRGFVGSGQRLSREIPPAHDLSKVVPVEDTCSDRAEDVRTQAILDFASRRFVVAENIGTLSLPVELCILGEARELSHAVTVRYKTRDGTAKAPLDYEHKEGVLEFSPGVFVQQIEIKIVDDEAFESLEEFYVDLFDPDTKALDCKAVLGANPTASICILDDDRPGIFAFKDEKLVVQEGLQEKEIRVQVLRRGGCVGKVSVEYRTEDGTAQAGKDYSAATGVLEFASGQACAEFPVTILARGHYDSKAEFKVSLCSPSGGAQFEKKDGVEQPVMTVTIGAPGEKERVDKVVHIVQDMEDKSKLGHSSWTEQFIQAIQVNGGEDSEDEPPGMHTYVMHWITIPWKVLFATIPPSEFCNGWLCFVCSLVYIGLVTAFINDLAGLLGCTMGLPDAITAITFVALGTSLPDTFASKLAATQDPYADASVGNVTGSNSVNVFLGIGLSWMVGAMYWESKTSDSKWAEKYPDIRAKYPDGLKFVVIGGDLGFSVVVFCVCALSCLALLVTRRAKCGGELGGPPIPKYATSAFLVGLWLLYVALSSWKVLDSLRGAPCS